jgi:uncharacterized membrane protein YdbT with pleckstrin-like domain
MENKVENKPLIMKSHLINAILPKFLKHLFWNGVIFIFLYGIYKLVDYSANYNKDFEVILYGIIITILFSIIKISKDVIIILNSVFYFYDYYLEKKIKLFHEDVHSINYSSILDIKVKKNIWDRMCGVGDILIYTANDEYLDKKLKAIVLKDIKNPDKIKRELHQKIEFK